MEPRTHLGNAWVFRFAVPSSTTDSILFRTVRYQMALVTSAVTGVLAEINALPLELQCREMKEG